MIQSFCGLAGADGDEVRHAVREMAVRLARGANDEVLQQAAEGWCTSATGGCMHRFDDSVLLLAGRPRLRDAALAERAQGEGLPRVLYEALRDGGADALASLAGDYSLALVQAGADPAVLLAVDRMGVGDLYWRKQGDRLVFATALPALAAMPAASLETDPQSLFDYVYFHMIPAPATVYKGVQRVEQGTHVVLDARGLRIDRHADVRFENEHGRTSVAALKPEFRALVEAAVSSRAPAQDAVGSFLSGGTDSSTVTGYLGQVSGRPAQGFSIGFDATGFDEMEYARTAARHFGADLHEYYVTPEDIVDLAPRVPAIYGQPFGNSSVIPTFFCARLGLQHGMTTMLAGDGGDELFGGNTRYAKQKVFALYDALPAALRSALIEPVADRMGALDFVMPLRKIRRYVEQAKVAMPERLESYNLVNWFGAEAIFTADFLATVDPTHPALRQRQVWDAVPAGSMLNRMLALDFKFTLADNDLRKVRSMCEFAGMDVAFPLLDDDLVDFSARLPLDMKVKGARLRHFFKEALRDFLPPAVISKSKHGFGLPFGSWVATHAGLRSLAFDWLADFRRRGIVREDFLDQLTGKWINETPNYYGTLVWLFMMLEGWHQQPTAGVSGDAPVRPQAVVGS